MPSVPCRQTHDTKVQGLGLHSGSGCRVQGLGGKKGAGLLSDEKSHIGDDLAAQKRINKESCGGSGWTYLDPLNAFVVQGVEFAKYLDPKGL